MELNIFDLTGLPFDPPEKSAKKVKLIIEKKIKEIGTLLGSTNQQIEREEKTKQLSFLKESLEKILTEDGKKLNESEYMAMASHRVDTEMKKLKSTAFLMSQSGSRVISNGTIRFQRRERKLSEEHVKEVFTSLGFSIVDIDPLGALPKFPTNAERTLSEIIALSKTKDPNPAGADTSLVTDLYAFAAYLKGEPENAALYRSKTTSELIEIFDTHAKKFAMRNDNLGKMCASLSTDAKKYVFNSEDNRKAYEDFLKYKSPSLSELFESMRGASREDLLNARFAEPCIKRISEVFGDYEASLAIYNKEAGLKDDPYIPSRPVYHIKCDYCGQISEFASEIEAQRVNQCTNCKKELFKKCSKCSKVIPVSKEKCPHCGFVFAGAALFGKYYRAAEDALRKSDFESARRHLYDAQTADPSESQRINQLKAKIEDEEKKYSQPIQKLRELIAGKMFSAAEKALYQTIKQYPALNVSSYETQIRDALSRANSRFEASKRLQQNRQADECVAILRECSDHQASQDFLRTHPPAPCKSMDIHADTQNGVITVSWSALEETGVYYRLEKTTGTTAAGHGCEVLQEQTSQTSYRDKSVRPGQTYTYTVYAVRFGTASAPVSRQAALYTDVRNFHVVQNRSCIRLTWDAPENSIGAKITRFISGKATVLTKSAYGSYEDNNIQYGIAYTYKIEANYSDSKCSPGIESVITPLLIVDSFKIKAAQVKDNIYKISWDIRQPDVDLRIHVNKKLIHECKSNTGQAQIKFPMETFNTVCVMAYSGGTWVESDNTVQINTYTSCSIDKDRTELREESISTPQGVWHNMEIKIRLADPIPSNVQGFYYAVRTASDTSRWASISDINRSSDIQRVSINHFNEKKEIIYTVSVKNETSFYISVFTIYAANGQEIVSEPKAMRLDRPVFADLFWKVSKSIFGGIKLFINVTGNRPLEHIPELVLCACYENEFITSHEDSRAIVLMQIPTVELETAQKEYSQVYDIQCNYSGKDLKRFKLFLFEKAPVRSEKFTLRWQQGFSGKV